MIKLCYMLYLEHFKHEIEDFIHIWNKLLNLNSSCEEQ